MRRREAIIAGAEFLAGFTMSAMRPADEQSPPFIPEAAITRESVEKQFGVTLTTLQEVYSRNGKDINKDYPSLLSYPWNTYQIAWNTDNLAMAANFLSQLPPQMHQPNEKGKLVIVMGAGYFARDYQVSNPPRNIQLDASKFNPGNPKEAYSIFTHEISHTMIEPEEVKKDVKKLLGKDFKEIHDELEKRYKDKMIAYINGNPPKSKELFSSRFYYSLMDKEGYEFVAIMAELYLLGPKYFTEIYEEFFPPATVSRLYNYTRDRFFGGNKEY